MTGMIITGVTGLLMGLVLLLLALSYMKGKNTELIAGWKELPEDVKAKYGSKIAYSNGKTLLCVALTLIVYAAIAFTAAFGFIGTGVFIASTAIFIAVVVVITVVGMIKTASSTKKR